MPLTEQERRVLNRKLTPSFESIYELTAPQGYKISEVFHKLPERKLGDYYRMIKKPLSLHLIKTYLNKLKYQSANEYIQDLAQIIWNAKFYNIKNSEIYNCAIILEKFTKSKIIPSLKNIKIIKEIDKNIYYPDLGPLPDSDDSDDTSLTIHKTNNINKKTSSNKINIKINSSVNLNNNNNNNINNTSNSNETSNALNDDDLFATSPLNDEENDYDISQNFNNNSIPLSDQEYIPANPSIQLNPLNKSLSVIPNTQKTRNPNNQINIPVSYNTVTNNPIVSKTNSNAITNNTINNIQNSIATTTSAPIVTTNNTKRRRPPIINKPHENRIKNIFRLIKKEKYEIDTNNPFYYYSLYEKIPLPYIIGPPKNDQNDDPRSKFFYQIYNTIVENSISKKSITLDTIKLKIRKRDYKSLVEFLNDLNILFNNFKNYFQASYQFYLNQNKLLNNNINNQQQPYSNIIINEIEKANMQFNLRTVLSFEAKTNEIIKEEEKATLLTQLHTNLHPSKLIKFPLDSFTKDGKTYKVGDWILIKNKNDDNDPIVGQLFKIWELKDGTKYINACWYYKPQQTVHRVDRMFYENEVFKSGQYRDHLVDDVIGKCFVVFFTRYQKSEINFDYEPPLFICEYRYSDNDKIFNKIRTWKACLPEEVRHLEDSMTYIPLKQNRTFQKYDSPLKHLLPPNATYNDPIPEPTMGHNDAPPLIGSVYLRDPISNENLDIDHYGVENRSNRRDKMMKSKNSSNINSPLISSNVSRSSSPSVGNINNNGPTRLYGLQQVSNLNTLNGNANFNNNYHSNYNPNYNYNNFNNNYNSNYNNMINNMTYINNMNNVNNVNNNINNINNINNAKINYGLGQMPIANSSNQPYSYYNTQNQPYGYNQNINSIAQQQKRIMQPMNQYQNAQQLQQQQLQQQQQQQINQSSQKIYNANNNNYGDGKIITINSTAGLTFLLNPVFQQALNEKYSENSNIYKMDKFNTYRKFNHTSNLSNGNFNRRIDLESGTEGSIIWYKNPPLFIPNRIQNSDILNRNLNKKGALYDQHGHKNDHNHNENGKENDNEDKKNLGNHAVNENVRCSHSIEYLAYAIKKRKLNKKIDSVTNNVKEVEV
ncbi:Rsc2p [Ascoidea rubescens DSM 1968]|uniref:BAH-domain-containing protein n=1 Tax=Ascoidea rubescens DSM 1968 TaxID=1344418 RepID=A0A1D2VHR8_9ASCO|nr:BAH-domain-containing protein [Ascoidea rubescens DSM 1968]ODV61142.1 BAH-domain-containing protein [Ascoidea rubescens DSM 1968]